MTYVKRLVMQGFKSFVKKTELPFTEGINVILGPNGSGKSNVSDALCFVLGRLSIKSMRAAKASNLIFMGSKAAGPAKEASVEIVFDNENQTFSLNSKEVGIKRIVRKNGQSIYKINNETKTRQDVLSLLAQAGIDPNGFNIILQGEIQNFVKMHTEERRKIIEEVSGISIYESRKEKALKELNKTDEKLKETTAVLRERTSYLNNLEKERQQALKYKKLEEDIKKFKASIIYSDLTKKKKEAEVTEKEIEKKNKEIEKVKSKTKEIEQEIKKLENEIDEINKKIQTSTGLEQEKLNQEIANLRAELAGMKVRYENHEKKLESFEKQKAELNEAINNQNLLLKELKKESPAVAKKEKELEIKKKEIEKLEQDRKKFYTIKTEIKSIKDRLQDKYNLLNKYQNESDFLLQQIQSLSIELFDKKTNKEKLQELKSKLEEKRAMLKNFEQREKDLEKQAFASEHEINEQKKVIEKIEELDICPLCKNKITASHINSIHDEIKPKIDELNKTINKSDKELNDIYNKKQMLETEIEQISSEVSKRESDLIKLANINDKNTQIKVLQESINNIKNEIQELEKRKKNLEKNFDENSNIEQKYETAQIEVREISLRSEENINSEISFKQREIERMEISLKQVLRDEEEIKEEIKEINKNIQSKEELLEKSRKQEETLSKKFQAQIEKRDLMQKQIREKENELINRQHEIHRIEDMTNNFKIDKARIGAEIENLEMEMLEFPNIELIKTNKESLKEKLHKAQDTLLRIGSVNLRSLEVYDEVKKEYDTINEKVETISKEKEGILKIIHEIDIKKKKTFLRTLNELNEIFSRNFSQLSTKGQVNLELENKKSPFEGGVNIIVKTGHGKYFDVTSLSGGEQTLVALSLIFAIQELNPYCFYILDEIDAALDKRNSERLANLLKKYMQKGQYIVITHNDEIISNATNLYGVSMHDGISKVTSLKL